MTASEPTFPDDEDVCLLVGVKVSERRHRTVVLGAEQVSRYILEGKRVVPGDKLEQKTQNIPV